MLALLSVHGSISDLEVLGIELVLVISFFLALTGRIRYMDAYAHDDIVMFILTADLSGPS